MASSGAGEDPRKNNESQAFGFPAQSSQTSSKTATSGQPPVDLTNVHQEDSEDTLSVNSLRERFEALSNRNVPPSARRQSAFLSTQPIPSLPPKPGSSRATHSSVLHAPAHSVLSTAAPPQPVPLSSVLTVPSHASPSNTRTTRGVPPALNWSNTNRTAGSQPIQPQPDVTAEKRRSIPHVEMARQPGYEMAAGAQYESLDAVPSGEEPKSLSVNNLELTLIAQTDASRPHHHCAERIYNLRRELEKVKAETKVLEKRCADEKAKTMEVRAEWIERGKKK